MENDNIGENAGKVWRFLSESGGQSTASIAKTTGLKSDEVLKAIGWLAREGKVTGAQEGRAYLYSLKG